MTPTRSSARRLAASLASLSTMLAGVAVVGVGLGSMALAPQPEVVPKRWQLDFKPGDLRVTTVDTPGLGPRMYLYFTYTVVNNSGEDLLFAPSFDLATDDGDLLRSGRNIPAEVTRQIVEGLQNRFALDQIAIIGTILQGKENAKEGVVIWPVPSTQSSELVIYAAGMSGETATVNDPVSKQKITLRKTWMGRYAVPGTLIGQRSKPLEKVEDVWVMR